MSAFEVDPDDLVSLWANAGPWAEEAKAAALLSIEITDLEHLSQTFQILGCEFPGQTWLFPVQQFIDGGVVPGLQHVCTVLHFVGGADNYRIADWLAERTSFTDPERTVWDELRDGNTNHVLQAARRDADLWKLRREWERYPPPELP
jgi:hypothetical protein